MERLIAVHTFAIETAIRRDRDGLLRVLALLRNTLDFSADPVLALGLDRLYLQCEYLLADGDFGSLLEILEHLRAIWKRRAARPAPAAPADGGA